MSNSYWVDRLDAQNLRLLDKTEAQLMRQVAKMYRGALNTLTKDVKQLYADMITNAQNGVISIADLYRYDRYYILANDLNTNLNKLNESSCELFEDKFVDMYKKTQDLLKKTEQNYFKAESAYAKDPTPIVNEIWTTDGKVWSERIWHNSEVMEERIMGVLVDCFTTGKSVDKVVGKISEEFGSGLYAAQRLIRTELSRIQNQSLLDGYIANGYDRYKILGSHDERTCEVCSQMIGKIIKVMEAVPGKTLPPFHPNGRCIIAPIIKGVNDK